MSTRSRIGIEVSNGWVHSIYCHHDGYLSGVGEMLSDHYQTADDVRRLIDLGDISSLSETVEATYPNAYRHEDVQVRVDRDKEEFWRNAGDCGEEFAYLYEVVVDGVGDDGYEWRCMEIPRPSGLNEALGKIFIDDII